jgi:hypothetical protein
VSDENDIDPESRGLPRRELIKKAAIVGAVAWTAPIILDSLASPAAAASANPNCYRSEYTAGGTTSAETATNPTCLPGDWACAKSAGAGGHPTISASWGPSNKSATFSITAGSCVFASAVGFTSAATPNCQVAGSSAYISGIGTTTLTLIQPGTGSSDWTQVRFVVRCNGAANCNC